MGKLSNWVLLVTAAALVTVGVAAQTGTVSFRHGPSGGVSGSQAAAPLRSPVSGPPTPEAPSSATPSQAPFPAAGSWPGGGQDGHGHGGGGDGD